MTETPHAEAYRRWRRLQPDLPAHYALDWAKYEEEQTAILARLDEWQFAPGTYGSFAHADLTDLDVPYTVRVSIGEDDQPVEWGDSEPSDEEREHASAFYVAIQVLDDAGAELYHDGIGGVDVIDLPGYLQRDWQDAVAYALLEYLLDGALKFARTEAHERAEWAARDVVTES